MVRDLHLCSGPGLRKCWGWGCITEPAAACAPEAPWLAPPSSAEPLSHTLAIQVLPGNC